MNRRTAIRIVAAGLALLSPAAWAQTKSHRLALQVSDNSPEKMNAVLNVAANVSRQYAGKGEEIEIEVVVFNAGLHMLRSDTSPVKERMVSFRKSMPNVSFKACGNTQDNMHKAEHKDIPLVAQATLVKSGVVRVMELQEQGWTYVRP